ncbi:MAG: response regulator transcription factor [Ktedonobacterales bacterium]|nr:response regulator transcription factor [Ktedonobacterales bacterium]
MALILIVEDERDLNNLLRAQLESEGHEVAQAFDGATALRAVEARPPDLIILDWMLPGKDGLTVCRQVRQSHLMPIMMLTARGEEVDRVLGLEVGADDYLTKPFGMREALARVRALLRRVAFDAQVGGTGVLSLGALRLNPTDHTVSIADEPLDLTPREFDVLALLMAHPGRAFSRDYLVERVWGLQSDGDDRLIDSHIMRLRKKLGDVGDRIVTVWGVGYRLTA